MGVKVQSAPLKYQQITSALAAAMRSGTYQVGDKLPSESKLAESFKASRSTVIRALHVIEEEGLIERRQGAGSFITQKASQHHVPRTALGILREEQSGRFADSIADQIQSRLTNVLQQRGSALIAYSVEKSGRPLDVAERLLEQNIGGVFLIPLTFERAGAVNAQLTQTFQRAGRPVVLLDGDIAAAPLRSHYDVVGIDNRNGGYLQTAHLLDQGLRRILFVGSHPVVPTVAERTLGYLDAMKDRNIDSPSEWICSVASDDINGGYVEELLRRHRPEGIVFKSDEFAALFLQQLTALGLRIPHDLKLVGFDDRPIASLLPTTLTTIRQPIREIAEAAIQLMDNRLADAGRAASRVQLAGSLMVRQSSAPSSGLTYPSAAPKNASR